MVLRADLHERPGSCGSGRGHAGSLLQQTEKLVVEREARDVDTNHELPVRQIEKKKYEKVPVSGYKLSITSSGFERLISTAELSEPALEFGLCGVWGSETWKL